ncbi:SDR family oxidoreductase [Microbacterium sp. SLBN-111]|uniref:SDR family oxidoreductase n=1 Tax=Microbacterium sp. SLBN-111 TaxID=3377733 RepID=UPI003C7165FF
MDITGNTVFIPGATSGIGLALAERLHAAGNTVIVGGRRQQLLDEIAATHPGIDTVRLDTADAASITRATRDVVARHPRLNVLVTMAGIMRVEDWAHDTDVLASAEETVTTNVLGPLRLISALLPHLQQQPDATVITVSSGLAFVPLRATPTYNATKAAIHMFTESLRLQLEGTTVSVRELVPPSVATDLLPGQRESAFAMPLDDFADEAMAILRDRPDATEILVERVEFLRHAEARGEYAETIRALNAADPHGR